ncbi:L,D-transpeptidase family protein [bacterium]|nr:L,D-transpeptidase family protein [bacterium]
MTSDASTYLESLRKAGKEGLDPEDYHLSRILSLISQIKTGASDLRGLLVDLDLLLTDSYLVYSSHLLAGNINPTSIDPEWHANRRDADLAGILSRALESNQITASLQKLLPPQEGYRNLRKAYQRYRDLEAAGNWDKIDSGVDLKLGESNKSIGQVRHQLARLGYLRPRETGFDFDERLEEVLKTFQHYHGLPETGALDSRTIDALNTAPTDRAEKIQVNLERWRWLPQELGERHVLVNIPNFSLDVIENRKAVLTMRAIVGKDYRRTPVFSDQISYVVLNPYWQVPDSIAVQDILPLVQKDITYLSQRKIRVFQGWGSNLREVDPYLVDWKKVITTPFPYHFRQDPGSQNALGKMKFMFPNIFSIYLHSTSSPELFDKDLPRTFSSGCIRIEKPQELLTYLTDNNSEHSQKQIYSWLDGGQERTIKLKETIPIHLLYWTAWADPDGVVHFRDDVYNRDEKLLKALKKSPFST